MNRSDLQAQIRQPLGVPGNAAAAPALERVP